MRRESPLEERGQSSGAESTRNHTSPLADGDLKRT